MRNEEAATREAANGSNDFNGSNGRKEAERSPLRAGASLLQVWGGQGSGVRVRGGSGFRVQGSGFRVQGSGFRV